MGVSKTYWNRAAKKHPRAKKHWMGFFYTDQGKFFSKNISPMEAMALKLQIRRQVRMVCAHCGSKFDTFKHLVMEYAEGKRVCPICRQ